jgi:hypothetical protein
MPGLTTFDVGGCCCPVIAPCDPGGCNDSPAGTCTWVYIHGGVTQTATTPTGCFGGVSHGAGTAIFDGGCGGSNVGPGFRFDMSCFSGPPNHMGLVLSADPSGASIFGTTEPPHCPPSGGIGCVSGFSGDCSPYVMEWTSFDFTGIPGGAGNVYIGYTFLSITYTP